MNLKPTPNNLSKLEKIFEEAKYILRFEKGTFNSGYCLLEHKKVVVVNKFLNLEGRINTLLDILPSIQLEVEFLTPESYKLYKQVVDFKNAAGNIDTAEEDTTPGETSAPTEPSSEA
ncbi:hypothetical protein LX64_03086 [Chitinophaga skermanii]|uniref:Uncharacterized protein n=1 Tax=Chitinophaga skermanii TaxID=331697 RepID=A0A327QJN5_9BACT|nr:hypothetical protein [Chitinophaga skermanii]RAJ04208.1 hypothetical protein LX64_03086 [Chitinophaga skermanii]